MILLRHVLSKSLIFLGISSNVIFAVNPVTSFSRQKPLKSKNQNHTNFRNSKFYHPANFEIKRIKTHKVFWNMAHLGAIIAKRVKAAHKLSILYVNFLKTFAGLKVQSIYGLTSN